MSGKYLTMNGDSLYLYKFYICWLAYRYSVNLENKKIQKV